MGSLRLRRGFDPQPVHFMVVRVALVQFFSPRVHCFPPVGIIRSMLHSRHHNGGCVRMTGDRSPGTFSRYHGTVAVNTRTRSLWSSKGYTYIWVKFLCSSSNWVAKFCVESVQHTVVSERTCLILLNFVLH